MRSRPVVTGNTSPSLSSSMYEKLKSDIEDDDLLVNQGRHFFGFGRFRLNSKRKGYKNIDNNGEYITSTIVGDEARYNLATRVMSNGVEVIVASDKNKSTHKPSVFRILPSNLYKPLTLAPSTLKDQMILVMPSESKNNLTIPINPNQFVTKTCLTTYTYQTTYLQDGTTTVESREKVISNIATEERNYLKISPTASFGVTLSRTPELAVGVFYTTYTYLNTILDGELPIVMSSRHTVTNTITGPDDYISFLQPSEEATPNYETNTYYSKIVMTKTLTDGDIYKVVSTSNVLTQVIVTESLPAKSTSVMTSYNMAFDADEKSVNKDNNAQYITYTYYNTVANEDDGSIGQTKKPSAAALHSLKTNENQAAIFTDHAYSTGMASNSINIFNPGGFEVDNTIHVYATKTYLTTFTYFTTLLKSTENEISSTFIDSHTRVIENVITESIPNYMLDTKLIEKFSQELVNPTKKQAIITMATLLSGQTLEITALNMLKPTAVIKTANNVITTSAILQDTLNYLSATPLHEQLVPSNLSEGITDLDSEDVENLPDSEAAESEIEETYAAEYNDATKVHNRNATKVNTKTDFPMANLIGSLNFNGLTALGPVFNAMAGLIQNNFGSPKRNVSIVKHVPVSAGNQPYLNISSNDNEPDKDHRSPIYIPVQGIRPERDNSAFHTNSQASPSTLHISPPEKWVIDEKMNRNNKLEFPLNKPTYEIPLLNGGIPISPGEVITANSDVIVGKPAGTRPRVPFNTKLKDLEITSIKSSNDVTPNIIPLNRYQHNRNGVDKYFETFIKPPPPLAPPEKFAQAHHNNYYGNKHFPHRNNVPHLSRYATIPINYSPTTSGVVQTINRAILPPNNEILEIKRIPEVYSTDLPPVEVGFQRHHIKKVISTDKTMLVNIQPSQVANVVIPHGNQNSVLIIESTPELHKNGQYFDEPSPYPNTITGEDVRVNHEAHKSILSNQQINLDSHVLSHNVDIHVPPITFKKENDFPFSTPVRGQIPNNGPMQMAHVNIPPTDHEAEINLTPQHVSLPNSYLQVQSGSEPLDLHTNTDEHKDQLIVATSNTGPPQSPPFEHYMGNGEPGGNFPHNQSPYYHNDEASILVQQLPAISNIYDGKKPLHNRLPPKPPPNTFNDHGIAIDNQRYSAEFDFGNNRKPPEFGNIHIHKGAPNHLKRRPIPSLNPHEKPFVLHHPKISNYKPRPIIPLTSGNYNHSHQFPIGLKPRQPINIPFTRQNTARPPQNSKRPDFYDMQQDKTRNSVPQKDGNSSSFYYIQDYSYQGVDPNISQGQPMLNGEDVSYNHRDDDYENEEGEVVQESNSLSVIPGQYLSNRPDASILSKPSVNGLDVLSSTTDRQNIATDSSRISTKTTTLSPTTRLKIPPQYISSPPSSLNNYYKPVPTQLPGSIRPPLRGRPFAPAPGKRPAGISHYKQPERPNIHQGERFKKPPPEIKKVVHGSAENLHAYVQVSLPINPSSDNYKEAPNLTQTESPFNTKYTQNPLKNISHLDSGVKLTNDGIDLVTTSTTIKPGGDETTKSKLEIENESGEEIFDFKESMNPHNLGVITNVNEDMQNKVMSTTFKTIEHSIENQEHQNVLKTSPNSDIYKNAINKDSSTIYSFGSEAAVNMKPPPPPPTIKTEEVMGLSPPPPPTSMSPPPISSVSPASNSPSSTPTQVLSPPAQGTSPSSPSIPIGYNTINFSSDNNLNAIELPSLTNRKPSQNVPFTTANNSNFPNNDYREPTTKKSQTHKVDTEVKYAKTSEAIIIGSKQPTSTPKYPSTTSKTPSNVTTSTFGMILKPEISIVPVDDMLGMSSGNSRLRPTTRKPSSVKGDKDTDTKLKNTKLTIRTQTRTTNITPTPSIKKTTSTTINKANSGHGVLSSSKNHHMFNSKQRIPDEILIVGSENEPFNEDDYTLRVSSDGRKNTAPLINITTKTRLVSKVVLPTKYITNTKTLTVTTTKTTVVKSQGTPLVQTLTLTKIRISTLVDTVTETETQIHTLLQPTKVTINSPPEIRTTITTIYTLPEHQNYPEYNNKDVNINGNNDETVLFVEDSEGNLDELIINYDDYNERNITVEHKTAAPTTISSSINHSSTVAVHKSKDMTENRNTKGPLLPIENESIFVVMSDQKNSPGIININASMMETPAIESIDPDYEAIPFDLPNRDEDHENRENHVLLGGILIATPPKSSSNFDRGSKKSECKPDCRASRNELCQRLEGIMRCVCRPGFARMFPDRPCKPTYTYSLSLPLHRYGKEVLVYDGRLSDPTSEEFYNLAGITYEALDRMVMQSDFRDVYHGVHVTGFEKGYNGNGIVGHFYLQLSDNSDENRLVDVFKKYLRHTNYSVGGTDLFTSKFGVDKLRARDFDECLDPQFHDCSDNSQCFNLHGTYTCSCKEGYVDLSENPVYPGRKCSADLIGCEKCYYHGTCYTPDDMEQPICECFHWYTGASCQVNLKILLIALIVIGVSLLILLLFCILVTCSKRGKTRRMQSLMAGINILPPKNTRSVGSHLKTEKRAMIKDSSSEASHNSDTLPYVSKKENKKLSIASVQSQTHINTNNNQRNVHALSTQAEVERRCNLLDQNDRSLTVMIPRAKYHPIPHQSPSHLNLDIGSGGEGRVPANGGGISTNIPESKILSYLDAGSSAMPTKKISLVSSKHGAVHSTTPGALVSAGFEVSATVVQDTSSGDEKNLTQKSLKGADHQSQYSGYKKSENTDGFIDPMDNWLDTMQQNELTVSEARSYDETTIQPPTKSLRSVYEKQPSQLNNDEANTMAERDVGSTFLLPHTHLYKPDRGSDISGFDSF